MTEDGEEFEPLIEDEPSGTSAAAPAPPINRSLIRGCRYARHRPGKWSFWTGDIRWDFLTQPQRRLFRRGEVIAGIGQVMCLDDAALFALGYEQGLQDMAAERKENLS